MLEDYTKYLSIDNGYGILINKDDAFILEQYGVDYYSCRSLKELIILIENVLDESDSEELEDVISRLSETYYYQNVKK